MNSFDHYAIFGQIESLSALIQSEIYCFDFKLIISWIVSSQLLYLTSTQFHFLFNRNFPNFTRPLNGLKIQDTWKK